MIHDSPIFLSPSGGHSLWLREELTSPFSIYQYFYNLWDSELEKFLRQLTFLTEEEIEAATKLDTSKRQGQKLIAEQVMRLLLLLLLLLLLSS